MPSTLEGVLVALAMALTSADPSTGHDSPVVIPQPAEACAPYADPDLRKNCLARIGRAPDAESAVYPSELRWVSPRDPGMLTWTRLPGGLR